MAALLECDDYFETVIFIGHRLIVSNLAKPILIMKKRRTTLHKQVHICGTETKHNL